MLRLISPVSKDSCQTLATDLSWGITYKLRDKDVGNLVKQQHVSFVSYSLAWLMLTGRSEAIAKQ